MRWLWRRRRRQVLHPPGRGRVYVDLVAPLPEALDRPAVRRAMPSARDEVR
jgi:hypothetical protein